MGGSKLVCRDTVVSIGLCYNYSFSYTQECSECKPQVMNNAVHAAINTC